MEIKHSCQPSNKSLSRFRICPNSTPPKHGPVGDADFLEAVEKVSDGNPQQLDILALGVGNSLKGGVSHGDEWYGVGAVVRT